MIPLHAMLASKKPLLMGVVNVTPNSFSDGNRYLTPAAAVTHGRRLVQEGAALLDLGAEASSFFRPGVEPVPPEEQLRRLLPVVEELATTALLSIDTRSATVARACLKAGAAVINDISAGEHDPAMLATLAEYEAPLVLMHISPTYPATPPSDDADIVQTVRQYLERRVAAAIQAGIARERLWIDPGVGFGKTMADNWRLVGRIEHLAGLGLPVVLGVSRKRFLEFPPPTDLGIVLPALPLEPTPPADRETPSLHPRDILTAQVTAWAAGRSIPIHRVHHVALARRALA